MCDAELDVSFESIMYFRNIRLAKIP